MDIILMNITLIIFNVKKEYSLEGSSICQKCPSGTYSSDDKTECLDCLPGHISEDGESCQECPEGTFSFEKKNA